MHTPKQHARHRVAPILATLFTVLAFHAVAHAQVRLKSNVEHALKWTWSENIGWLNWRDGTGNGMNGARFHPGNKGFISGYVWSENVGWIHLGNAAVAEVTIDRQYPNTNGSNYGVNILPSGYLSGFAWSENIGWISFSTEPWVPALGARFEWVIELPAGGTHGMAWNENIGWINLHTITGMFVALHCRADLDDGSGLGNSDDSVDISDLLYFLEHFEAGAPWVDLDDGSGTGVPDGSTDISDLLYFLVRMDAGC